MLLLVSIPAQRNGGLCSSRKSVGLSLVIQHIETNSHVLGSGCLGYIYIQSNGLGEVLKTSGYSTLALQMQKNEVRSNLNSVTKVNLKPNCKT